MIAKVKARDHESYGTYSLITILIPLVGFIVGIVYLTKDDKLDRKFGEHLIVLSILATLSWAILMAILGGSLFRTPQIYQ